MCGIVGYVGKKSAVEVLVKGLRRLEYRGYDSAGVAFFEAGIEGKIDVRKSEGKLENVEKLLDDKAARAANCGIGHTRWATHGKPTTQNAHPHRTGHVVLVHNGIIENYQEIKKELVARGHQPQSETDSELFGFLVLEKMNEGRDLLTAVREGFTRLHGECSVVVMSEKEPGKIVGVRRGSPLVAACGSAESGGGAILASDAQPMLDYTRDVVYLDHGDVVVATDRGIEFFDLASGRKIERPTTRLEWSVEKLDRQGYEHYMLKEIHEQPTALTETLNGLLERGKPEAFRLADQPGAKILHQASDLILVACGTSWHAALLGKYWMERWASLPTNVELASEFRYRQPVLNPKSVILGLTQSGETADTLAVIRQVRSAGLKALGLTNVRGSTLSREADDVFFTSAGPEIGVAATKTFTAQMMSLLLMAGSLGMRDSSPAGKEELKRLFDDLIKLPHLLTGYLAPESGLSASIRAIASKVKSSKGYFFIGRGYSYPIALEGALKLKEIAYVHAEGYAGGELKHGPIAMIDPSMTIVVLAPPDRWREKIVSNLEEVKARGGVILSIGGEKDTQLQSLSDHYIKLPQSGGLDESLYPFLVTAVIQLLSYELALLAGTDVDKPRNLAKSVTVE
jgi:glucosamine--fructose-6-phosphate aminotransferase (isomerizing)